MYNHRSATYVTGVLLSLAVFKLSLVVSQDGTTTLQENNYHKVPCDFENGLCGWRNLNPDVKWTITEKCEDKSWGSCKKEVHYLRLKMNKLQENGNSTLRSPSLVAKPNILIVGKKLANTACHNLDVDNIKYLLTTKSSTTEPSTFSSLSRRVSTTSFTSLEVTSTPSSRPDGTGSFTITPVSTQNSSVTEPMLNPDKQTSDDDGLGTGPVVAIVIVIVSVVVVVVVIVVIVIRRRNSAEKHSRESGSAGSTSPGDANVGGIEGHDNLVYSANRLEMDTIPPMSGNAANPENTPDYYNVSRINSPGTGPSAPAQEDVYENTRSPPPDEEYAVVNKNGKKKQNPQPEDEYALPNKDQQKKKKREKQAGQGQQKNDIPTKNKKKKGRKTDHQANTPALNSNAAGRSTQAEEAAAAGTSDYEPVGANSGMTTRRPEQPSDMYNKLRDKERAGMLLETPQTHYDHLSAPDGDYSGMDLEDKIRDQQREAVADQYSHI